MSIDGINHINIYSQARTELGRWMSNFTSQPIETEDGFFESIEGYWYWLGKQDERLRYLSGFAAKQLGRSLPDRQRLGYPEFKAKIEAAIRIKVADNPPMAQLLASSTLPLTHYYEFQGRRVNGGFLWVLDIWRRIRTELQA